jgi:hypothetical protein
VKHIGNSLPVLHEPIPLRKLRIEIDKVAREQQIVLRRHGHRIAHERGGVDGQGTRHRAGDDLRVFLGVHDSGDRDTEV